MVLRLWTVFAEASFEFYQCCRGYGYLHHAVGHKHRLAERERHRERGGRGQDRDGGGDMTGTVSSVGVG